MSQRKRMQPKFKDDIEISSELIHKKFLTENLQFVPDKRIESRKMVY